MSLVLKPEARAHYSMLGELAFDGTQMTYDSAGYRTKKRRLNERHDQDSPEPQHGA